MSDRRRAYSGAPWEEKVGYCRALRTGNQVYVTGTAPISPSGETFAPGDAYRQARHCLQIIEVALMEVGAKLQHVTRTRMFVTDIEQWEAFGRAHAEMFGVHRPATTMVEVRRLIHDDMLIEIEADAVVDTLT